MKKILCICSKNKWRSPTAEEYFRSQGYETISAGIHAEAQHIVTSDDIQWSELIIVMEERHKRYLLANFPDSIKGKALRVLHIPDKYRYNDPRLIKIFSQIKL